MESRRARWPHALLFGATVVVALELVGARLRDWHPAWGLFATLWVLLPASTLVLALAVRAPGERWVDVLALRAVPSRYVLAALLAVPVLVVLAPFARELEGRLSPFAFETGAVVPLRELSQPARWLLLVASPALCEELFFRGALLSGLRRGLGAGAAVAAAGALFGAAHVSSGGALSGAAVGLVAGWLAVRGGSVVPAIVLHAAFNAWWIA